MPNIGVNKDARKNRRAPVPRVRIKKIILPDIAFML